jgi:hypothetical protein
MFFTSIVLSISRGALAFGVLGHELEVGVIGEVVNGNSGGTTALYT